MPTVHEKTWVSKANILPAMGANEAARLQSLLFELKKLLTGGYGNPGGSAAWTVAGSSNGVTGAMDGVDRLAVATSWVMPTSTSSPRGWLVLKSPGTFPIYLTISIYWSGSATPSISPYFRASYTIPSGYPANGAVTALTYPADVFGSVSNPPGLYAVTAASWGAMPQTRVHGSLAHDGSFEFLIGEAARGVFHGRIFAHRLVDTRADEIAPWMVFDHTLAFLSTATGTCTNLTPSTTWSAHGLCGRMHDGSQAGNTSGAVELHTISGADGTSTYKIAFPGGLFDDNDPAAGQWALPIWVTSKRASDSKRVFRGRLADVMLAPSVIAGHGQCEPSVLAPKSVYCGPYWIPMLEAPDMS